MEIKAEPRSDQVNADDLIGGPVTVTVKAVNEGKAEQPYDFELVEYPGRCYRPNKSMLRVLIDAWGDDGQQYAGRRMTLYRDPSVRFGPDAVGGIRISHLSDIDKSHTSLITVTRGKRKPYTVQPLIETDNPWPARLTKARDLAELKAIWDEAVACGATRNTAVTAAKDARKKELDNGLS